MNSRSGVWIPLVEYAVKKDISLSTLRRHIKAGKILHKAEHGRYLIFDDSDESKSALSANLTLELQKANEEIAELKMLIAFYEEKQPASSTQN